MMNAGHRIKLPADADEALVAAVEHLAVEKGQAVEALLDEALRDLLAKHGSASPDVMQAYNESHDQFAELYKKLAQ